MACVQRLIFSDLSLRMAAWQPLTRCCGCFLLLLLPAGSKGGHAQERQSCMHAIWQGAIYLVQAAQGRTPADALKMHIRKAKKGRRREQQRQQPKHFPAGGTVARRQHQPNRHMRALHTAGTARHSPQGTPAHHDAPGKKASHQCAQTLVCHRKTLRCELPAELSLGTRLPATI